MNTPNNAAALERIFDAIDRVEALCAKSNKLDRERLLGRVMVNCADELSTLRAALLPREGMTNIVIGATRHYGGEAWFRELTVAGVTFLAPLDEQEKARGILSALTSQPSGGTEAEDRFEQYVATLIDKNPDVRRLGERLAYWLDEDRFNTVNPILLGICERLAAHPSDDAPGVAVDEVLRGVCMRMLTFENSAYVPNVMFQQLRAALAPKPEGEL